MAGGERGRYRRCGMNRERVIIAGIATVPGEKHLRNPVRLDWGWREAVAAAERMRANYVVRGVYLADDSEALRNEGWTLGVITAHGIRSPQASDPVIRRCWVRKIG